MADHGLKEGHASSIWSFAVPCTLRSSLDELLQSFVIYVGRRPFRDLISWKVPAEFHDKVGSKEVVSGYDVRKNEWFTSARDVDGGVS